MKIFRFIKLNNKIVKEKKRKRKALIEAKKLFSNNFSIGMCSSLEYALYKQNFHFIDPEEIIPEFNPIFLQASRPTKLFWWDPKDKESRIKAFDTLIKLYE